jgi:hypothetical protein
MRGRAVRIEAHCVHRNAEAGHLPQVHESVFFRLPNAWDPGAARLDSVFVRDPDQLTEIMPRASVHSTHVIRVAVSPAALTPATSMRTM